MTTSKTNLNEFHFTFLLLNYQKLYIFLSFTLCLLCCFRTSFLYNYLNNNIIIIIIRALNAFVQNFRIGIRCCWMNWNCMLAKDCSLTHSFIHVCIHQISDFLFFNWILHEIWLSYCNVSERIVIYCGMHCTHCGKTAKSH